MCLTTRVFTATRHGGSPPTSPSCGGYEQAYSLGMSDDAHKAGLLATVRSHAGLQVGDFSVAFASRRSFCGASKALTKINFTRHQFATRAALTFRRESRRQTRARHGNKSQHNSGTSDQRDQ